MPRLLPLHLSEDLLGVAARQGIELLQVGESRLVAPDSADHVAAGIDMDPQVD